LRRLPEQDLVSFSANNSGTPPTRILGSTVASQTRLETRQWRYRQGFPPAHTKKESSSFSATHKRLDKPTEEFPLTKRNLRSKNFPPYTKSGQGYNVINGVTGHGRDSNHSVSTDFGYSS